MNTPKKLWPYQPTTSVDDAAAWADVQPVRYTQTRRVTLAEIEPWQLNEAQRQAADERAQHARYMQAQAGSREGVADMEDEDKPPMTPAAALLLAGIMALSAVISIGVMAIAFGAFR